MDVGTAEGAVFKPQPSSGPAGRPDPAQAPMGSRERFRDSVMLVYLGSSALFLLAGLIALLERLGIPLPEDWTYTLSVMLTFGVAFAAVPAAVAALVVIARLWREPAAWVPAALWLATIAAAALELSRESSPTTDGGEHGAGAEYVILGLLGLYTVAAGYSGLRWLAQRRGGIPHRWQRGQK